MTNRIIIFWTLNLEKFLNSRLFSKSLHLFLLNITVPSNSNTTLKKSYDTVINYVHVDFKNSPALMRIRVIAMHVVYVLRVFDVNTSPRAFKKS